MAVLFDLDQTLIDSRPLIPLRQTRQRAATDAKIAQLLPYPGIPELLGWLQGRQIPVAIVTSSRRPVCDRILQAQNWSIPVVVCRHDVPVGKPHPAGILKALQQLGVTADRAVMVGDAAADIQAARAAGVYAIAALWGAIDPDQVLATDPDYRCLTVETLHHWLRQRYAD
jgi:HAD superfamily hydrolase (TIGR01662 family)